MTQSEYCYPNSKILINKLNISDSFERYLSAEKRLVSIRIAELVEKPIKGSFNFEHLSKIHLHLFQDIYDWAGKTRNCYISKNGTWFCAPQYIKFYAEDTFGKIKRENFFLNLTPEEKIKKLAELFADINALHPFREGNGRTQRIFIEWLATVSGISLDLTRVSRKEISDASEAGMGHDYNQLFDIFFNNSHSISEDVRTEKIKRLVAPNSLLSELSRK